MTYKKLTRDQLIHENEELKLRLAEYEKALRAFKVDPVSKIKSPATKEQSGETTEEFKNRYTSLYNAMSEGLAIHEIIYDSTGKASDYIIRDVNPAFERITGLKKKKIMGKRATEAYSVPSAPYLDIYSEVASTGIPQTFDTFFLPMNKHFHVSAFRTDKGIFSTVFQDITGRKKNEEALRRSEERYHQMFGQHQAIGLLIEPETGAIVDANSAALKYYGYTYQQICSLKIQDINQLPSDQVEAERKNALTEHRNYFVFQHRLANGEIRWVEVYSSPLFSNDRQLLYSIIHDISSRKIAEESLRVSEERFSSAFRNSPNAITITRLIDGKIIEGNDSVYNLLGYKKDEVIGKTTSELDIWAYPDDRSSLIRELSLSGNIQNKDFILCKKDKTHVPVNLSASLITIDNQQCLLCSFIDLTERKQAADLLAFQSRLLSEVHDAVFSSDINFKINFWNHAAQEMFGWTKEEALGKNSGELLKPKIDGSSHEQVRSKLRKEGHWIGEAQYLRKDGTYFYADINSTVLRDNDDKYMGNVVVCRDISERKNAEETRKLTEEKIRQSEERYRNLFSVMPSGVAVYEVLNDGNDPDGKDFIFKDMNPSGEKIDNVKREEIIGKSLFDIFPTVRDMGLTGVFKRVWNTGVPEYFPVALYNDDRILLWFTNYVYKLPSGEIVALFDDITERMSIEKALKDSEEQIRVTLTSIGDAVITVDRYGIVAFMNPVAVSLTGWQVEEAKGQSVNNVFRLIDETTGNVAEDTIGKVLREGKVHELSNHTAIIKKDGQKIPIEDSAAPIKDQDGKIIGVVVVFHDVTEKRKAAEALKESEKRFRTLTENIPDLIVRFDKDLRFLYGNKAVLERTGLSLEYITGKTAREYGGGSVATIEWEKTARKILKDGVPRRIEQTNKWQNKTVTYDSLLIPEKDDSGKVTSVVVIARDITERKEIENALKNSEQHLKYHLENSPLAVVEWDKDFNILQWSAEAEKMFGQRKEEVLGVRIDLLNIIYAEDLPIVNSTISQLTSGRELKVVSQNRNITKNGKIIECIWYNSVLLNENGEMNSVMSLVEDVTLLRNTERNLIASQENYKELVTNARSIIVKLDNDAKFTFINEFALDFFGYREEELLGKSVMIIVPEKDSTGRDLNEIVKDIVEDPDTNAININENIKKDGEKVWVEWHNKTLFDDSGRKTGYIAIGIDVTKRKKAEDDLRESEIKLRSVINAARESIYMFDNDGHILMSNRTGIERLNKSKEEEVVGHSYAEFMTPELTGSRKEKIASVFSSGLPLEYEDMRSSRTYFHSFFPVYKDNIVQYVVSYSTDITERKKAEQYLIESEERFRTIAESLTVMIVIKRSSDSQISFINEPFAKSFGFTKQDLLGKIIPDIYYFPDDNKFLHDLLKIKGIVENMEIKVKRNDGSTFWIMTSFRQIIFNNEPSFLMTSIDISETKRAQEELLRLNRTLDAQSKSSQALMHATNEKEYLNEICQIIIEDCGYTMVWVGYAQNDEYKSVNPVAYFGFDKGYIDNMKISWDDNERGRGPTGSAIRTGKPSVCQNMFTDPCFEPWREAALARGYSSSIVLPLKSEGKAFGAISIYSKEPDLFSDAEINLLADLADDLAYGISFIRLTEYEKEATQAIKENEIRLKELIATKDKFFNIIAHDLKNPFTSLLGASELLYDNIEQMTPDNVKKLSLILNDSAKGGYAILQNLLDWSRSQTGMLKFNPEIVNLKSVIDENIENLQLQITNKEIKLTSELQDDLFITADINMINTILRNLLSNAVKYTYKNGMIVVKVLHTVNEITLSVKDTGIGIEKDKADKLFRLENSLSLPGTEKEQGTGLGLKLCKEFTEKMGGKIWVESDTGKGSEFKFTIPITTP